MTIRDIAIAFGYQVDRQSEQKAENSIQKLKSTATKLLGAIGIGFSLVKMNALIEEFGAVNNQIRNATSSLGDQHEVQQKILAAANASRSAYRATADIVSNLAQQNQELFPSVDEAAKFAELTTKLFKTAGKSNQEIAGLQEAINKSFAKGIVDSETINQLYEKSPEAINLIAKSLGVASSEIQKMAADGKVSLETLKTAFTSNADLINAGFENVDLTISDAILNIRNGWGLWLSEMDKSLGLTQTVGKIMIRSFNAVLEVLKKIQTWTERISKAVGGIENLLKLLAIVGGTLWVTLNAKKITDFLVGVSKSLGGINAKVLTIVAVVTLIALVVEDFINFMKGNGSVIGDLLEKAGVDVNMVRETIVGAWNAIREFLFSTWGKIKQVATDVWDGLKQFWAANGEKIMANLSAIWGSIVTMLSALWEKVKSRATTVFEALRKFWDAWGDKIKNAFAIVWNGISSQLMTTLDIIADVFSIFASLFTGDWEGLWESVKSLISNVWKGIVTFISTVLGVLWALFGDILTNIWNKIVEIFTNIWDSIVETVTGIKDSIIEGFTQAIDWIKSLPAQALTWGKDIIQGIIDGIKSKIGGIVDSVKNVGSTIKKFLGFSVPDEGPLTDFPNWMPHFMGGLAQGIEDNIPMVKTAIKEVGVSMNILSEAKYPSPGTASTITSNASNRSVVQNVNIDNTYNGEIAAQKNVAKSMNKAAGDATSEMARGLAYAK